MKIRLLIHNGYAGGGTVRTTMNTAGALAERAHDVEIVSMRRRRRTPAYTVPPGVRLYPLVDHWSASNEPGRESASLRRRVVWAFVRLLDRVPSVMFTRNESRWNKTELLADIQLIRWIRAQKEGVLVGTRPGINLALARWAGPGPVVVAQHHLSSTVYRKALKEEFRRCYPRVDAVVSLTKTDAAEYAKVVEHKTRVLAIPNGVPDVHGCAATAKPDNDSKLVVVGARLTRQKGIDRLLDVWALVAARHPDWRLEIYGSGDATVLQQKAVELGIADSALFMGRTSRLPEVMSGASIFVLTSRFEGFPMVLLEAMTIGLPVVSYDCPTGPSELIEDGRNGYLVPNGDAETFADRLSDLMQDPGKRRAFGAAATEITGRYDTHVLAERWEQLFTELAADPRRAERRAPRPIGRRSEADPCARLAPRQTLTRLYQGLTAIRPVDARTRRSRSRVASKKSSTA